MKRHEKTHTKERIICHQCGKGFTRKEYLAAHIEKRCLNMKVGSLPPLPSVVEKCAQQISISLYDEKVPVIDTGSFSYNGYKVIESTSPISVKCNSLIGGETPYTQSASHEYNETQMHAPIPRKIALFSKYELCSNYKLQNQQQTLPPQTIQKTSSMFNDDSFNSYLDQKSREQKDVFNITVEDMNLDQSLKMNYSRNNRSNYKGHLQFKENNHIPTCNGTDIHGGYNQNHDPIILHVDQQELYGIHNFPDFPDFGSDNQNKQTYQSKHVLYDQANQVESHGMFNTYDGDLNTLYQE